MGVVVCINYEKENTVLQSLKAIAAETVFVDIDAINRTTSAFDAKVFLFHYPPPWDLAHIDFLRELKYRYTSVPIIVTSEDLNAPAQLNASRSAKVLDFIVVPQETTYLRASIETILKRRLASASREVFFTIATPTEAILSRQPPRAIDKAVHFLSKHYARKLTIVEVADYSGVSSGVLYQSFKREYLCGFREYLQRYRLTVARRLLCDTEMFIAQVAFEVGYEDVSLFVRLFKDKYGCCPSVYRKRHSEGFSYKWQGQGG